MSSFVQCIRSLDSSSNIPKLTSRRFPTIWLGVVIYYWGEHCQNQLLLSGYLRWTEASLRADLADRFWYVRYDARGPHLFLLFRTTYKTFVPLRRFLTSSITLFLEREPSTASYSPTTLRLLHDSCRGRSMCDPDRKDTICANNSYAIFSHPSSSFPLGLVAPEKRNQFAAELDRISRWALAVLHRNTASNAIQWIAAVDDALDSLGLNKTAYWAYHFASLTAPGTPLKTPKELAVMISPANLRLFETLWTPSIAGPEAKVDVARLLHCPASDEKDHTNSFRYIREINHCVLNQLGLPCRLEIPLVLYAWYRAAA